jgi:hypothetical protein
MATPLMEEQGYYKGCSYTLYIHIMITDQGKMGIQSGKAYTIYSSYKRIQTASVV